MRITEIKNVLSCLLILSYHLTLAQPLAQYENLTLQKLDKDDDLSQSNVQAILIDRQGFN